MPFGSTTQAKIRDAQVQILATQERIKNDMAEMKESMKKIMLIIVALRDKK